MLLWKLVHGRGVGYLLFTPKVSRWWWSHKSARWCSCDPKAVLVTHTSRGHIKRTQSRFINIQDFIFILEACSEPRVAFEWELVKGNKKKAHFHSLSLYLRWHRTWPKSCLQTSCFERNVTTLEVITFLINILSNRQVVDLFVLSSRVLGVLVYCH